MLITGNIGGINFPQMKRGEIYEYSYINLRSHNAEPAVLNPLVVFSAIDDNGKIQGLNIRLLRNQHIFIEDFKSYYYKNGKMLYMDQPEHKFAFSHKVLNFLFKRNPDISNAWRLYDPKFMRNITNINIDNIEHYLDMNIKRNINNIGVK